MRASKRVLMTAAAVITAASMMAACGRSEDAASAADAQAADAEQATDAAQETDGEQAADAGQEAAEAADGEQSGTEGSGAEEPEWDGDITNIKIALFDIRGVADHSEEVVAAMNEITEKTCGVHAEILFMGSSDYTQQVPLMIASGDALDVMSITPGGAVGFVNLMANKQLTDLSDYLDTEGPQIKEILGDYGRAMSSEGDLYGVPCWRNYASANYLIMRKDILDKLGLTEEASNLTKFSQIEDIFQQVKDKESISPDGSSIIEVGTGIIYKSDDIDDQIVFDTLGDSMNLVYVDPDGRVSLLLDNPDYRKMMDRMVSWRSKGYFWKDIDVSTDHVDTIMKAGTVFASIQTSEMGVDTAKQEATGYEVVTKELSKNLLASAYVNKFGLGVPVTSQEPEAAVRWINALYSDPRLENLLIWGIEGRDYVVRDGEACFPDGVTAKTVTYHSTDFMYGNYFSCLPWEGQGADFRDRALDYLKSAPVSPYLGFNCDLSDMTNTQTAINSVYQEYYRQIWFGNYDDRKWNQYIAELKDAGIDSYLQGYQDQLDAWKEANNVG